MSTRDEETLLIVESDPDSRRPLVNFLKTDYKVCGVRRRADHHEAERPRVELPLRAAPPRGGEGVITVPLRTPGPAR